MLGDCPYCGDRLTSELRSVTCDSCGDGFHGQCASDAGELSVEVNSGLSGSTDYTVDCPDCEDSSSIGFDPRE